MFYITFSVFQAHLNTILSCPHQTTGRRLCTTDMFWFPPTWAGRLMRRENVNNMPDSSRETETEGEMRDRQQRDRGNHSSQNIVSLISQFADDNLTLVRVGLSSVWPATDWRYTSHDVQMVTSLSLLRDSPAIAFNLYGVSSRFIGLRQRGGHLTLATSSKDSPQWQNVLTAITSRPQWGGSDTPVSSLYLSKSLSLS